MVAELKAVTKEALEKMQDHHQQMQLRQETKNQTVAEAKSYIMQTGNPTGKEEEVEG